MVVFKPLWLMLPLPPTILPPSGLALKVMIESASDNAHFLNTVLEFNMLVVLPASIVIVKKLESI